MATRGSYSNRQRTGQKASRAVSSKYGTDLYRSRGRSQMSRQEAGRKGGLIVASKYGPDFYREIGAKGGHARKGSKRLESFIEGQS
ncbi:KGG domain-containing protein [Candidatus Protochlamydia phocaeensis]|uniref:KGG domain-containing protein n=1 Tax=Candidatus Protochlamydia phocaeensis TaxID=1414722 RepID=UPI000839411C|nr:KGG domain-containing protein [Candidatus Protochlamydia phocaeensis]